jgi:LacI family transcriptional regulator
LLALPEPPTALFAYQDSLAALVIGYLADAGVSVPQQMTVVGFDNLDLASYISPRLTTIGGHIEPLATQFMGLLLERIQKTALREAPQHLVVTPQLVVRKSCAPPRNKREEK